MRQHQALAISASLLGLMLAVAGAAGNGPTTGSGGDGGGRADRLAVVATTTVLADFARTIGGDRVQVTGLLKPNVDAHDFDPSPADLDAIARADVLLVNGVGLEEWLDDAVTASGFGGDRVDTSTGVKLLAGGDDHAEEAGAVEGEEHAGEEPGGANPHIWHSPINAKLMSGNVQQALARVDPDGAATYKANHDRYAAQLDQLDAEITAQINALPNKKLVTNHDAFAYYVDRYKLEFVGSIIPSFDTSAELSAREVTDLVAKIRSTGVKAVFSEASLPPQTAQTIAAEAGVKVVVGDDALYGDGLGPPGSDAATYLDSMRHNTRTIVDNLK
jgi:ABC-type Zn uptake system ZnuABC Zn-binding protein ZnuA